MQQDKIWDYFQNSDVADVAFPEARHRYFVRRLNAGQRVLNVGIGNGGVERLALKKGCDVYSLDPNEKAICRLAQQLGLKGKAKAGYAQDMPFDSDYFDVVVISEVLEHLDNHILPNALLEVFRVLKAGGKVLISVPYKEDLLASQVVCPHCGNIFHKVGHVQSYDKARMRDLLVSHGFVVDRMWLDAFVDWRRPGLLNFFKSMIRVMLAKMGESIADPHLLVVARKP